jgi:hypothetical protein
MNELILMYKKMNTESNCALEMYQEKFEVVKVLGNHAELHLVQR